MTSYEPTLLTASYMINGVESLAYTATIINKWAGHAQAVSTLPIYFDQNIFERLTTQNKTRFQHFTGANTLLADLSVDSREEAFALWIAAVVNIEAAGAARACALAEELLIPGLIDPRGSHAHLTIVLYQLNADINAFVANITGMPFKEPGNFPFTQTTKGTA